MSDILLPGQPLPLPPRAPLPLPGPGTYKRGATLRSSLLGLPTISSTASVRAPASPPPVPQQGSIVLGKITHLSPTAATLAILVVDGLSLPATDEFVGVIRSQDVRSTEKDRIRIGECFRGGDVVRAQVLSLGDARSYYLSTARNELGVVFATSEAGATMQPVSWQEMRCPRTGQLEKRKCAKPEGI
ncbi:hypothetical protein CALVIDRAFT_408785 [Calocera viscosa TUFC12733]|uniref:S1 motif domain-containing protein n=1 Tax=Calocera viscosa (strain TUFC12733) TaxID=1330018 RepID=A0A167G9G4_CALVF|nr:hypothetical protein CALVIDRAFT_408785 [Calocera viscosa TUFC12733]